MNRAWLAVLLLAAASPGHAAEYTVDPAKSVFAVLTHKAGIGSAVAHDHLIVAPAPFERFDFDAKTPEQTTLDIRVAVAALEVDPTTPRAAWAPVLQKLGLLTSDLPPVSDGDRARIREAMLGASQLDGEKYPEIHVAVAVLGHSPAKDVKCWKLKLGLTIRDETVERLVETCSQDDENLELQIVKAFRFSDFGIEPYSALLGAIRNDDVFHVFVHVVANHGP